MGIFNKDCPKCAASNRSDAAFCHCGYCFDATRLRDRTTAVRMLLEDEKLYADYLQARVEQAQAAATAARAVALAEPESTLKAAQALQSEQALHAARAELRAQQARLQGIASGARPAARAPTTAEPKPRPSPSPANDLPAADASSPTGASRLSAKTATPSASPKPDANPAPASAPAEGIERASTKPRIHLSPEPSIEFRRRQSVRAADLAAKKAVATARSEPDTTKECPHCTAELSMDARQCRCGYVYPPPSAAMPALQLDPAAVALVQDALEPLRARRR